MRVWRVGMRRVGVWRVGVRRVGVWNVGVRPVVVRGVGVWRVVVRGVGVRRVGVRPVVVRSVVVRGVVMRRVPVWRVVVRGVVVRGVVVWRVPVWRVEVGSVEVGRMVVIVAVRAVAMRRVVMRSVTMFCLQSRGKVVTFVVVSQQVDTSGTRRVVILGLKLRSLLVHPTYSYIRTEGTAATAAATAAAAHQVCILPEKFWLPARVIKYGYIFVRAYQWSCEEDNLPRQSGSYPSPRQAPHRFREHPLERLASTPKSPQCRRGKRFTFFRQFSTSGGMILGNFHECRQLGT